MTPKFRRRRFREDQGPELPGVACHKLRAILDGPGNAESKLAAVAKLLDEAAAEMPRVGESISRAAFKRRLFRGVRR